MPIYPLIPIVYLPKATKTYHLPPMYSTIGLPSCLMVSKSLPTDSVPDFSEPYPRIPLKPRIVLHIRFSVLATPDPLVSVPTPNLASSTTVANSILTSSITQPRITKLSGRVVKSKEITLSKPPHPPKLRKHSLPSGLPIGSSLVLHTKTSNDTTDLTKELVSRKPSHSSSVCNSSTT